MKLIRKKPPSNESREDARRRWIFPVLVIALIISAVAGISLGAVRVPPESIGKMFLHAIGFRSVPLPSGTDTTIILHLRLPRVLAAVLVGSALSLAGAVMQGLFRNPMASPDVLGVSAGSSLGAVLAVKSGIFATGIFLMPLFTIAGALTGAVLVYAIASFRGRTSLLFIILAGLAFSSFFNGLVSAVLIFSREYEVSQFIFWTMGGLDGRTWSHVLYPLPLIAAGMVYLFSSGRELNLLALGEENAHSLGLSVEKTKRFLLVVSAAVTGVAISVSGPIGFVGLLIPHLFRLLIGPDHRKLLPVSALGGAVFLILCDLLGRLIMSPFEIRVGVVTALLGSPYFIYLIIRYQRKGLRGFL